jgi:hypothetical protein
MSDPVDDLFALPPAEFVAARDRLAAELKKGGKAAEAKEVKSLARPTVSAWVVNQLSRREPEALGEFLEATDRLREEQLRLLGGGGQREAFERALADQRGSLTALLGAVRKILESAGHAASPALVEKAGQTLRAAALSPAARQAIEAGRLSRDVEAQDFTVLAGQADGGASPAPSKAAAKKAAPAAVRKAAAPDKQDKQEKQDKQAKQAAREEEARRKLEGLRDAAAAADKAADEIADRLTRATTEKSEAASLVKDKRRELAEAQERLDKAERTQRELERDLANSKREARAAAGRLAKGEQATRRR